MADFTWPDWLPAHAEPPPPEAVIAEFAQADGTREQQLNDQYLAGRRQILSLGDNAYYRQQGEAAIHATPTTIEALRKLKDDTLAQAGNDRQHRTLAERLEIHHGEAMRGLSRHLDEQGEAWKGAVADNHLRSAEAEAAVNHNDPALVSVHANGAYNVGLRSADEPPESEAALARATAARSSVYRSAIEAAISAGDNHSAIGLYDRARDQLTPGDAGSLDPEIKIVNQTETGRNYVLRITAAEPPQASVVFNAPKLLADVDAAHRAATARNDADWVDDPSQRATNQHLIDVQFEAQKRDIEQANARLGKAVTDWVTRPRPDGSPQTDRPPPALWKQLAPDEQQAVDANLRLNARGSFPATEPAPGSEVYRQGEADLPAALAAASAATEGQSSGAATATAAAGALGRAGSAASTGGRLAGLAARAAPVLAAGAAAAAPAVAVAAPLMLIPMPSGSSASTIDLDDGLRARMSSDQGTVEIERRVDGGLLGTGIGAKWERVPVDAKIDFVGPNRLRTIAIDTDQLQQAIGPEAADQVMAKGGVVIPARPSDETDKDKPSGQKPKPGTGDKTEDKSQQPDDEPPPFGKAVTLAETIRATDEAARAARRPPDKKGPPPLDPAIVEDILSKQRAQSFNENDPEQHETRRIARNVSKGHAYDKHVMEQAEYPVIRSPEEFGELIEYVMNNPTEKKAGLLGGRTAYWHDPSGTIVFRNPRHPDGGTVFRPSEGRAYFETKVR